MTKNDNFKTLKMINFWFSFCLFDYRLLSANSLLISTVVRS